MKLYILGITILMTVFSACGKTTEATKITAVSQGKSLAPVVNSSSHNGERTFSIEKKLVAGRNNTFKGDLNGDGIEDSLYVVDASAFSKDIPAGVNTIYPWKYYGEGSVSESVKLKSKIGFFIQLGSRMQKQANYFIADVNSPSVLDTDAAMELTLNKVSALEPDEAEHLKKYAKGDLIVIPTEAGIDTYLYWTADTFSVYEPLAMP
jgi:hypothetical protein